jgi:hypothetical protein
VVRDALANRSRWAAMYCSTDCGGVPGHLFDVVGESVVAIVAVR